MKFDKKIDLDSVVRKSVKDAMKSHGLLKEQEQQKIPEISDQEMIDHTAFIALKPKEWGKKGTVSANEIDMILKNLSGGVESGMQRYVNCLNNMSRLLGVKVGKQGLPVPEKDALGSLSEVTSALMLRTLLNQIISEQSPQVAGKIFENFVARMVGGSGSNDEDQTIEDLFDNEQNPISLKVIDVTTKVKGSKINLAKGIVQYNKGVRYLICIKDQRKDPFSFKTISFVINKENYFNFITGQTSLTSQDVQSAINKIVVDKRISKQKTTKESLIREVSYGPSSEDFNAALQKYAEQEGLVKPGEQASSAIRKKFIEYYNLAEPKDDIEKKFYDTYLTSRDKNGDVVLNFAMLKSVIPSGEGGKNIIKKNDYYQFKDIIERVKNITAQEKQKFFGENYQSQFNSILKKLNGLLGFFHEVDVIVDKALEEPQTYEKQAGSASEIQEKFFIDFELGNYEPIEEGSTQFKMALSTAIEIARASKSSEYSEDYPTVIIDKSTLFISAEENARLIKEWYTPIYKKFFKVDSDLKKFFIGNELGSLNTASTSTKDLKDEIDVKVSAMEKKGAGTASDIKAQPMQENKKQPLTKSILEVIFDEID